VISQIKRFPNSCHSCIFLGSNETADLYYDPSPLQHRMLLAIYAYGRWNFTSDFSCFSPDPDLKEAMELAVARGLLPTPTNLPLVNAASSQSEGASLDPNQRASVLDLPLCATCAYFEAGGKCTHYKVAIPDCVNGDHRLAFARREREPSGRCKPQGIYWRESDRI
jgi:hypothetical protein